MNQSPSLSDPGSPTGTATDSKLLLRALGRQACARPPIWLMRQAGRYLPEYRATRAKAPSFLDFCYTPELAIEVTLQPIRRYGFDAAILFSDIMVVPHALGQQVWFEEGRGPRLDPVGGPGELGRLSMDSFDGNLAPVYETVRGIRSELGPETALIGFAGAPWTVASYMVEGGGTREFSKVKTWAYRDPEGFQGLIDLLVDATTLHLESQIAAGVEVLQLFDSWAGALTAKGMRRWCLDPNAEIIRRVKANHPDIPIILFPRGAGLMYQEIASESGADAVAVDSTVPATWARDMLQSQVAVQGNLDPILLVAGGEALRESATEILETLAGGPFVFNLGSGIVPEADPEHVRTLVELVRGWSAR